MCRKHKAHTKPICDKVIETNTATLIRDPYKTPPISPKLAGTAKRV